ncbi:uncharacterized protein O3C94_014359 [Discoglossus pictus]
MEMPKKILSEAPETIFSQNGQVPSDFDEVAVYFSKEEWDCLTEQDKELYKEVMIENYQNLMFVGHANVTPTVISMIEQVEEPYVRDHLPSEENPLKVNADSDKVTSSFLSESDQEKERNMRSWEIKEEEIPVNISEDVKPPVVSKVEQEDLNIRDQRQVKEEEIPVNIRQVPSERVWPDTGSHSDLRKLVMDFPDMWAQHKNDCGILRQRQYRFPTEAIEPVTEIIDQLEQQAVIRKCSSSNNSPLWPVKKRNRWTTNYLFHKTKKIKPYTDDQGMDKDMEQ